MVNRAALAKNSRDVKFQLLLGHDALETVVLPFQGGYALILTVTGEAGRPHTGAVLHKTRARPASRNWVFQVWIRLSLAPC